MESKSTEELTKLATRGSWLKQEFNPNRHELPELGIINSGVKITEAGRAQRELVRRETQAERELIRQALQNKNSQE